MDERALSMRDLLCIHEGLLDRFGGMRGVTEQGFGKLDAAVAAPYVSMFGEDLYPDPHAKAGVLFYRIARSHGFSDGNKRVALVALLEFLQRHALDVEATGEDLYAFVMGTASDWSLEQVQLWLGPRIRRVQDEVSLAV